MAALDVMVELTSLMERWERESSAGQIPTVCLDKIADLIERETEEWQKTDPDPFDDRHPGRASPECTLGQILKGLFKNDNFMTKLASDYLTGSAFREHRDLHAACCRILLDIMPGLETTVVFQENEGLVQKLMNWAQTANEPLKTYAVALLGPAMEIEDVAANFKESNATLVPAMIQKLHVLKDAKSESKSEDIPSRPFKDIGKNANEVPSTSKSDQGAGEGKRHINGEENQNSNSSEEMPPPTKRMRRSISIAVNPSSNKLHHGEIRDPNPMAECSNSWSNMPFSVRGTHTKFPLTVEMQQRLILHYLVAIGEYQEFLCHVFELNAVDLICHYIDHTKNSDVSLAFDATRFLAALLCHKKFAVEFIGMGGVEKLLEIPRPSIAATGASMCFYYLAYFEDAMERVCLLPHLVLNKLVQYVLWLLESCHESGRCHATMFFGISFPFKNILELFDHHDGLRKLYNMASTLELLISDEDTRHTLAEDEIFTSLQATRHVMVALRKYFEAHLCLKANQLRRMHFDRNVGVRSRSITIGEIPSYKAAEFPPDVIEEDIELMLDCMPLRMRWDPVTNIIKLGGVQFFLQVIALISDWNAYSGKAETLRAALDVLTVMSVTPRVQLLLCDVISTPDDDGDNSQNPTAMSVLLGLAEGEALPDPGIMKSALRIIINCVYSPSKREANQLTKFIGNNTKRKHAARDEELLMKLWESVRTNNGIMVLLKLLRIKAPITEADSIRVLACKALVGLARCEKVKQIIGTLLLLNDADFQLLMKEPVLQDKRQEHIKFCRYANELIELVSGKSSNSNIDMSLERIRKADVVAQTKIIYQEKELLSLIHDHLQSKGLRDSANALRIEANLPQRCSPPPHPSNLSIYSTPSTPKMGSRQLGNVRNFPGSQVIVPTPRMAVATPGSASRPPVLAPVTPSTPTGPIKFNIINSKINQPSPSTSSAFSRFQPAKRMQKIQKQVSPAGCTNMSFSSPIVNRWQSKPENSISLDKIVTEYLRKQHALCEKPVVTCPPFSLLEPHQCPDPKHRQVAPFNITKRLMQREYQPPHGGPGGMRCSRKYIYSRFRPIRSYRDTDEDGCFSCCAFSADEKNLLLGTYAGEMKIINIMTSEEIGATVCHNSPVTRCEPSPDGQFLLTSSSWGRPLSGLWSINEGAIDEKHLFDEENHIEFSKLTKDKIIATYDATARIYDVATCTVTQSLYHKDMSNGYTRNQATFNYTDDLVLNDGVLWDVDGGKPIHKFDKFNSSNSGVFHPMGMEVIINSEVWDLRTFRLLHTVPGLDKCKVRFNHSADVIFGTINHFDDDAEMDDEIKSPFGSAFRTFDAGDYSQIATIDVKKNIFDLCADKSDCYLAVVENVKSEEAMAEESFCHLYAIGRSRGKEGADDEEEEEEDEAGDDAADDDDDEDDDDDDDDDADIEEIFANAEEVEMQQDEEAPAAEQNENEEEAEAEDDEDVDDAEVVDLDDESDLNDSDREDDDDDIDNFLFELSDVSNF